MSKKKRAIKSKSRLNIFVSLNSNSEKLDIFAELELEKIKLDKANLNSNLLK